MLSVVIFSQLSYPAMLLAEQLAHQRLVHSGPLVLRVFLLKLPTDTVDRGRTVSRRSEPSSRPALMGEQPNPWDLLQPQDVMSRHRTNVKRNRLTTELTYINILYFLLNQISLQKSEAFLL